MARSPGARLGRSWPRDRPRRIRTSMPVRSCCFIASTWVMTPTIRPPACRCWSASMASSSASGSSEPKPSSTNSASNTRPLPVPPWLTTSASPRASASEAWNRSPPESVAGTRSRPVCASKTSRSSPVRRFPPVPVSPRRSAYRPADIRCRCTLAASVTRSSSAASTQVSNMIRCPSWPLVVSITARATSCSARSSADAAIVARARSIDVAASWQRCSIRVMTVPSDVASISAGACRLDQLVHVRAPVWNALLRRARAAAGRSRRAACATRRRRASSSDDLGPRRAPRRALPRGPACPLATTRSRRSSSAASTSLDARPRSAVAAAQRGQARLERTCHVGRPAHLLLVDPVRRARAARPARLPPRRRRA